MAVKPTKIHLQRQAYECLCGEGVVMVTKILSEGRLTTIGLTINHTDRDAETVFLAPDTFGATFWSLAPELFYGNRN